MSDLTPIVLVTPIVLEHITLGWGKQELDVQVTVTPLPLPLPGAV
jgi:hypothetical protein